MSLIICPITHPASRTLSVQSPIRATCVCNKMESLFLHLSRKKKKKIKTRIVFQPLKKYSINILLLPCEN